MRIAIGIVILSSLAWTEPASNLVPSYEFQGPKRVVRPNHNNRRSTSSSPIAYSAPSGYLPRLSQQPAPPHLSSWGGTVVSPTGSITTNGPLPPNSIVCIGRGGKYVDQAQVITSGLNTAQIQANGVSPLLPGDWVSLISVPMRDQPASYGHAYSGGGHHPTSSNADPRYQQWLHQGFTLGRVSGHRNCPSSW
ncbi:hypothetical protein IV102_34040 [bacterium]|nr:hypothetical protein [bacterium]